MIDQQLIDYIKNQIKLGRSEDVIKAMLKNASWQENIIEEAFLLVKTPVDADIPLPSSSQLSRTASISPQSSLGGKPLSNKLITTIAVLGSLLVGAGVILWIASNWEAIPRFGKVALIFSVIIGTYFTSFYLQFKKDYPRVGRALAFLGCLLFGAGIILIAQIFNIEATSGSALLFWSLLILPLVLILKLGSGFTLSAILFALWGIFTTFHIGALGMNPLGLVFGLARDFAAPTINYWYPVLLLIIFIPLAYYIRSAKIQALNIITLGLWINSAVIISFYQRLMQMMAGRYVPSPGSSFFIAILMLVVVCGIAVYLIGKIHLRSEYFKKFSTSYYGVGLLFILGVSFILSFKDFLKGLISIGNQFSRSGMENLSTLKIETTPFFLFFYIILIAISIAAMYIFYLANKDNIKRVVPEILFSAFLLIFSIVFIYLIPLKLSNVIFFAIFFNLILFAETIGLIFIGYIQREKIFINLGLLFFAVALIARYFDLAFTLIDRSLFFIIGGLILIGLSIGIERQRRKLIKEIS